MKVVFSATADITHYTPQLRTAAKFYVPFKKARMAVCRLGLYS